MSLPGVLEIRGLRCPGRHGAYPGEQDSERIFLVDLALEMDVSRPASSDRLEDASDLALLARIARDVVGATPRSLLEKLAAEVGSAVLRSFPNAEAVRVRVVKPDPPGLDAVEESVAIRLEARR